MSADEANSPAATTNVQLAELKKSMSKVLSVLEKMKERLSCVSDDLHTLGKRSAESVEPESGKKSRTSGAGGRGSGSRSSLGGGGGGSEPSLDEVLQNQSKLLLDWVYPIILVKGGWNARGQQLTSKLLEKCLRIAVPHVFPEARVETVYKYLCAKEPTEQLAQFKERLRIRMTAAFMVISCQFVIIYDHV